MFLGLLQELQTEAMRRARLFIYEHDARTLLWDTPLSELGGDSARAAAEKVCHVFNTAGFLARQGLIRTDDLIYLWGPTLVDMRIKCDQLIDYRRRHDIVVHPLLWGDLDWLATQVVERWDKIIERAEEIRDWQVTPDKLRSTGTTQRENFDRFHLRRKTSPPWGCERFTRSFT